LKQAAYRLAEEVYRASSAKSGGAASGASGPGAAAAGEEPQHSAGQAGETVEDADYEVVDDDGKKK
jgi:hypothetical protein